MTLVYYLKPNKKTKILQREYTEEFKKQRKKSSLFCSNILNYVYGETSDDQFMCSSAGILFKHKNEFFIQEVKLNKIPYYSIPGGKREYFEETSVDIAAREFLEEVIGLENMDEEQIAAEKTRLMEYISSNKCKKIWLQDCKYNLFIVELEKKHYNNSKVNNIETKWINYRELEKSNIVLHPVIRSYIKIMEKINNSICSSE